MSLCYIQNADTVLQSGDKSYGKNARRKKQKNTRTKTKRLQTYIKRKKNLSHKSIVLVKTEVGHKLGYKRKRRPRSEEHTEVFLPQIGHNQPR